MVVVLWADAHGSEGGWVELDSYQDDGETVVRTAGFLVAEGAPGSKVGHVTVWQSLHSGEGIHGFHIPCGMVRSLTVFEVADHADRGIN